MMTAWTYTKSSRSVKSGRRSRPITESNSVCAFFWTFGCNANAITVENAVEDV